MAAALPSLSFLPEFGGVLQAARELDMDVAPLCQFREGESWWERSQIWGRLMRELRFDGFPIRVAQRISIAHIGPLGMAAQLAPDLGSAFQTLVDHHHIFTGTAFARIRDDVAGGTTLLEHLHLEEPDLGTRCRSEMSIAHALVIAREICGQRVRPRRVCFRHAAPRDPSEHEAFFNCEVRFGAEYCGLEFDRDTLAIALPGADVDLSQFLVQHLRAIAGDPPPTAGALEARVQQVILGRLGSQTLAMAAVAHELGMSTRTLGRRLLERRTSYHEILDGVRRELADELLGDPKRKLLEVALRLGFFDASTFHRAYVRWTGRTPASRCRAPHGPDA